MPEWSQIIDRPYLLQDQVHFRRVVDRAMAKLEDGNQAEDESVPGQQPKAKGMTFNPVQVDPFRTALADLPKQFERKWTPGFYDAVRSA